MAMSQTAAAIAAILTEAVLADPPIRSTIRA